MSHLVKAKTKWVRGYMTTGDDLKTIDQNTYLSINGDEGGSWSPSSPIVVGGAGWIFAAPSRLEGTTDIVVTEEAPLTFDKGTAGDFFGLESNHEGSVRVIHTNFVEAFSADPANEFSVNTSEGSITATAVGIRFLVPLNVYNGSIISSVEFVLAVGEIHTLVPQQLPRFRVFAVDTAGTVVLLRVTLSSPDGFMEKPRPLDGTKWTKYGAPQRYVYVCTVEHIVDLSRYSYFVEIVEEDGTNSWTTTGNTYLSANATCSDIQLLDGRN